jgi:hypothetical protein
MVFVKASCFVPVGSQVVISYGTNSGTAVSGGPEPFTFTDEATTCNEKLRYAAQVPYASVNLLKPIDYVMHQQFTIQ